MWKFYAAPGAVKASVNTATHVRGRAGHNPIFRLVMYTTAKLGYALSQLVA